MESLQCCNVLETGGISNFHLLIVTQLNVGSQKKATINYSLSGLQKI